MYRVLHTMSQVRRVGISVMVWVEGAVFTEAETVLTLRHGRREEMMKSKATETRWSLWTSG